VIEPPPHTFVGERDPFADLLVLTAEVQAWAGRVAWLLAAAGGAVPDDLQRLLAGQPLTRYRWLWLLHAVQCPRPLCPF
jgi:hypothetical protein